MDLHTTLFLQHRPRLFGLAYRMLGIPADAEDVLHEAWLRWHHQPIAVLDDPLAWLVTVTTRLALDQLRRVKAEREHYAGPWLPEPLTGEADQPYAQLAKAQNISLSFLALLERLSAEERAAFLLHSVFDYSHAEAACMLGIAEDTCRQRVHRAKVRLREGRPRFRSDPQVQRRLLARFAEVLEHPTADNLRRLFSEDAVLLSDGGGVVRAALRPLRGVDRLTRLYLQIDPARRGLHARRHLHWLNGEPALLIWLAGQLDSVVWIETDEVECISAVYSLRHPEKLARLAAVTISPSASSLQ